MPRTNGNGETYGKTALIDDLTARTSGITKKQIDLLVTEMLELIEMKVEAGKRVTIPGFGSWVSTYRSARVGVNLHTKQKIQIPGRRAVRFTPGSKFKARVAERTRTVGR
jgi:nucleoid DNA-binding protein